MTPIRPPRLLALLLCVSTLPVAGEPTNARESAAKPKSGTSYSKAADKERKARMSQAELGWEKVLEENLGPFYLPRYKNAKAGGKATPWDYVSDDPALPRVLLIGDSISCGYTLTVRKELEGKANIHRAPQNCGPTKRALEKLDLWLGNGKWDLIHFNFGIHDRRTKPGDYAKHLEEIVVRLEKTKAKLLWANSTPLSEGTKDFHRGMMTPLNQVAADIMNKHHITINDLHSVALPILDESQREDGCHFSPEGSVHLGKAVATVIRKELMIAPDDGTAGTRSDFP